MKIQFGRDRSERETSKRSTLENQEISTDKKFGRLRTIVSSIGLIIATGISARYMIPELRNIIPDLIDAIKIDKKFNELTSRYGDIDDEFSVSAEEKDALLKRIIRSYGMAYENGTLFYPATGKKVSVRELRNAIESYSEPIFINREGIK